MITYEGSSRPVQSGSAVELRYHAAMSIRELSSMQGLVRRLCLGSQSYAVWLVRHREDWLGVLLCATKERSCNHLSGANIGNRPWSCVECHTRLVSDKTRRFVHTLVRPARRKCKHWKLIQPSTQPFEEADCRSHISGSCSRSVS